MNNLYWPIYKNLESEFNKLMFDIHVDDEQLNVYSTKIGDLILRAATEIESITKDLYYKHGGTKPVIKFDVEGFKLLNDKYWLDKKIVNITSLNCFITNRVMIPFVKDEIRTGTQRLTYSWNNAYQNIKHNRAENIKFGNIGYLFKVLCALYILNILYKDTIFQLGNDASGTKFDASQGSDIFSVVLYTISADLHIDGTFIKTGDYMQSVYKVIVNPEEFSVLHPIWQEIHTKLATRKMEHALKMLSDDPTLVTLTSEELRKVGAENFKNQNFQAEVLAEYPEFVKMMPKMNYMAVLTNNDSISNSDSHIPPPQSEPICD